MPKAYPPKPASSIFLTQPPPASLQNRSPWFWLYVWLPAILACLIIATESTPTFSAGHTNSWLRPIFERFLGPISDDTWWWAHHLLRKTGHLLGYGVLVGLSFLRGWLYTLARFPRTYWRLRCMALAIVSTFLIANLDEWHQTYLPSRQGLFSDVLLDTCGALLLCGAATLLARKPRG